MDRSQQIYINGRWTAARGDTAFEVIDSSTEEVISRVKAASRADAADAVRAARAAFDAWAARPLTERCDFLERIAAGLEARRDELADLIAREVGMPRKLTPRLQVAGAILNWRRTAEEARRLSLEETVGNSTVVREAVGVVVAITPWNFPLHQITLKVAPALAAGCTVVLKPSEVAPLNAFALAEVIDAAGLPAGVFNLVSGSGPDVGEALVSDANVDAVSFTGSTRAGRRISEVAASTIKRVSLELGGKSASVVLDDADLPAAVKGTISGAFLNSGQACNAQTRLLVPAARYDEAKAVARQTVEGFTVGPAFAETSKLGPLVSAGQRERVQGFIRTGVEQGAELIAGGTEAPSGLDRGYFVRPTVLGKVDPRSTVAQEEIFGPVVSIITYRDEDDAVRIANDTIYGLAAGVWSNDEKRALRVARRLRAGQVDINGAPFNPAAPFGGFKQSGRGREAGRFGLDEFLEYKSIQRKA